MEAITGVMTANKLAWEYVDEEICPTCEEAEKEIMECEVCPECGGDLIKVSPDYIECEECLEEFDMDGALEGIECFDHTKLIGDWKKDEEGLYEPDTEKEFAAILTSSSFNCVQVVWSKFTTNVRAMCSPCFYGSADLDSGDGDITAYYLPEYLIYKEGE